jgi:hypothetical protein
MLTRLCLLLPCSRPTVLVAGYYAAALNGDIITRTVICPQGYFCPGGDPAVAFNPAATPVVADEVTIKKCLNSMLTVDVGAIAPEQCRELALVMSAAS